MEKTLRLFLEKVFCIFTEDIAGTNASYTKRQKKSVAMTVPITNIRNNKKCYRKQKIYLENYSVFKKKSEMQLTFFPSLQMYSNFFQILFKNFKVTSRLFSHMRLPYLESTITTHSLRSTHSNYAKSIEAGKILALKQRFMEKMLKISWQ